jgi:serine protease Do
MFLRRKTVCSPHDPPMTCGAFVRTAAPGFVSLPESEVSQKCYSKERKAVRTEYQGKMRFRNRNKGIFSRNTGIWLVSIIVVLAMLAGTCGPVHAAQGISKRSMAVLSDIGQATAELVDAVRPAVVNISTMRTIKTKGYSNPFFDDPFFGRFFGDRFEQPKERKSASLGSGVIVDPNGYILTADHVIQGADEIRVTLSDKREFTGKIVGTDRMTDIGIIKIDALDLPMVAWGNSDALRVGETVLAIGCPYGLNESVTMGIVSAVGRANVGIADYEDFIQTDAAINPGNSGGALVNVKGELVGINTAIFSTSGGYQGIGFAVPSNMAKVVMESLIREGRVVRGWMGVVVQGLTPELARQFNLPDEKGALVSDVIDGGPAQKAGLQRGDVIVGYGEKRIEEPNQIRNIVAATPPGRTVELMIFREKRRENLKIVIGELPFEQQEPLAQRYDNVLKGVNIHDLTPDIIEKLKLPKKVQGVVITRVEEMSPAAKVLLRGDIIMEINREKITTRAEYEDAISLIEPGTDILLLIYRGGTTLFITLSQ